jgi:hypothetical protein
MGVCGDSGTIDFTDPCIRASWSALLPFAVVLFLLARTVTLPLNEQHRQFLDYVKGHFHTYITLEEAEALRHDPSTSEKLLDEPLDDHNRKGRTAVPLWRSVVYVLLGLSETLSWFADGSYRLITDSDKKWEAITSFLIALAWLYTVIRPITRPQATPAYDLFVIYCLLLIGGVLQFGGAFYDHTVYDVPLPSAFVLFAYSANLVVVLILVVTIFSMPMALPPATVKTEDIVSNPFLLTARKSETPTGRLCHA